MGQSVPSPKIGPFWPAFILVFAIPTSLRIVIPTEGRNPQFGRGGKRNARQFLLDELGDRRNVSHFFQS